MFFRPILIAAFSLMAPAAAPAAEPVPTVEEQVLAGINAVRTNPAAYAAKLREYRTYFAGNLVTLPGSDVSLRTKEGVAAVDQAIAFLSKMTPQRALVQSPPLAKAAEAHAQDQSGTGTMGHVGSDGSDPRARIKKQTGSGYMAEALSYGARDAEAIVRQLIVDDGSPTRPNRKILLDKRYFRAGVACAVHPAARMVCVIDLSTFVGAVPQKQQRNLPPQVDFQ